MRNRWPLWVTGVLLAAGCADGGRIGGPGPEGPQFVIQDATHNGGNTAFHFLPPIVANPAYSGTFDPGRSPVVAICPLANGVCSGPPIATFTMTTGVGSERVTMDPLAERYRVLWKTKDFAIATGETYRIVVTDGPTTLGYADVEVVDKVTGKLKNAQTGDEVLVDDQYVLQINFRIEAAADPSLVAYFPLDGDFQDHSGNALHATPYGTTPIADQDGNPSGAIQFNGMTDSLVIPAAATNARAEGTISLWLRLDDEAAQYNVFGKPDGPAVSLPQCQFPIPQNGYSLRLQFGGPSATQADRFGFHANTTQAPVYSVPSPLGTFTQWHLYTFTWSASATRSYLDGVLVVTAPGVAPTSSTGALVISPQSCPRNEMLKGAVDEVRIYNRELSGLEVAGLSTLP